MSAANGATLNRLVGAVCWLHVACNDERGNWAARAGAIHIETQGGATMDWQANDIFRPPRCSAGAGFVRVCGIKVCATARAEWVGNWCWDAWRVNGADVVRLLKHPWFVRGFSADEGTTDLWDAWHAAIAGPNKLSGTIGNLAWLRRRADESPDAEHQDMFATPVRVAAKDAL